MALLWADGFDGYGTTANMSANYDSVGSASYGAATGRFGGGAFQGNSGANDRLIKNLPSDQTDVWVGFALKLTAFSSLASLVEFHKSLTMATLKLDANDKSLKFFVGSSLVATSAVNTINANTWQWVEVRFRVDPAVVVGFNTFIGYIMEVWVDGVNVIPSTTFLFVNVTDSSVSQVMLGDAANFGANIGTWFVDDIYILTTSGAVPTTRLGDSRIGTAYPNSDAGPNNGTPDSGVIHYNRVNETGAFDTTTFDTLTNTPGQEERFGVGAMPTTPDQVFGVVVTSVAKKSDAGQALAHNKAVSGGVGANGSSWSLSTSYGWKKDIFAVDPSTSGVWSAAAVAAMKIGYAVE